MLQYPHLEFSAISFAARAAYHAAHCGLLPISEQDLAELLVDLRQLAETLVVRIL